MYKRLKKQDWPGVSNVLQIEYNVEDEQPINKNKNKTAQGICYSCTDIWGSDKPQ